MFEHFQIAPGKASGDALPRVRPRGEVSFAVCAYGLLSLFMSTWNKYQINKFSVDKVNKQCYLYIVSDLFILRGARWLPRIKTLT